MSKRGLSRLVENNFTVCDNVLAFDGVKSDSTWQGELCYLKQVPELAEISRNQHYRLLDR